MRKGHSILGLQVISQESATSLGKVLDLVFDHDADECIGLILKERGFLGIGSAQVVPWEEILSIGKDAVMVKTDESVVNPADHAHLQEIMDREAHLSGTRIVTDDGRDLGTFAEIYLDETTGKTVGYEVSGGFISDTMSGKRYIPSEHTENLRVGQDVLLASPTVADEFERQTSEEPGGLRGVYGSAKDKAADTYDNLATASVEQQKAFVVGKTAGRDVALPAPDSVDTSSLDNPTALAPATYGALLVAQGETITQEIADRAEQGGILHQLLLAVGATATSGAVEAAKGQLANAQTAIAGQTSALNERAEETQESLEQKAIGQPAGRDVDLPNGSTLVATGMIITQEMMDRARIYGKANELVASAGLGTTTEALDNASNATQDALVSAKTTAGNVFDTIKEKFVGLTGTAQEKKASYDEGAELRKINHALGRPITRILLAKDDSVILNTGDIITNRAIALARENDVLDVLLDAVYDATPEITPEMMRASHSGVAALDEQVQPTSQPSSAIVNPEKEPQDQSDQGAPVPG
ncbi:hypothetical protein IAD21_04855 [Abditibacteriota bacterium]|nr:hypothetical protein IAD21_04855 [Abditibacteriota bacterium]